MWATAAPLRSAPIHTDSHRFTTIRITTHRNTAPAPPSPAVGEGGWGDEGLAISFSTRSTSSASCRSNSSTSASHSRSPAQIRRVRDMPALRLELRQRRFHRRPRLPIVLRRCHDGRDEVAELLIDVSAVAREGRESGDVGEDAER